MGSVNVEIQTIEGGRLEWVGVAHFAGNKAVELACRWGDILHSGFNQSPAFMKPNLRLVSSKDGKVLGAWQKEGWTDDV